MMTDLKMQASLSHYCYTSDWEKEDLPPPPSLAQDTLLITPTPAQTGTWTRPEMQSGNGFSMSLADID